MVRKVNVILAATALVLVLVKTMCPDRLYEIAYVTVVVVGLVLSVFYLTTWGFYAIRAWWHGRLRFATVTVLEFVIIPILAVPSFGLALYNVWTMGLPVTLGTSIRVSRLLGLTALLLVMVLRTLNWVLRWRRKSKAHRAPLGAISDSRSVR